MTENECINKIQWRIDIASAISGDGKDGKAFEDLEMAIQALEKQSMANEILNELREYSSIGTVEEFKALKENQFFNFDSPVVRIDKKSYDKAIDDLCNEFHKDWEEQSENDMEDCINWYDWLIASAKQLKGE